MRTRDEDKRLRDDGNLQVYNGVELIVICIGNLRNTKLVMEEGCLQNNNDKDNPKKLRVSFM